MGKLSLDGKAFKKGLARAKAGVKRFGAQMKSALKSPMVQMGAAMAVAMIGMQIKKTVDWGTKIRDLGVKFGVSTKFVQQMEYAATQTGGSVDGLFKSFMKMARAKDIIANVTGAESAATIEKLSGAFKILGIDITEFKNKSPEALFMALAASIQNLDMTAQGSMDAIAQVFGGRGGLDLVNMFKNNLEEINRRFEQTGLLVGDIEIQKLGAVGDKLDHLEKKNRVMWANFMGWIWDNWDALMSKITSWAEGLIQVMDNLNLFNRMPGEDIDIVKRVKTIFETVDSGVRGGGSWEERRKAEADRRKKENEKIIEEAKKKTQQLGLAEQKKEEVQEAAAETAKGIAERKAAFGGFGPDSLERVGGNIGMVTSQLNVSQQQLKLMQEAQTSRIMIGNQIVHIVEQIKS